MLAIELKLPLIQQQAPLPTVPELMTAHEGFITAREAFSLSRTALRDAERGIVEIQEAKAEVRDRLFAPVLSRRFAEEVADVAIFYLSVFAALGVAPEYVQKSLSERLQKHPVETAPSGRRKQVEFYRNHLALLTDRAYNVQAAIAETHDPLVCPGCAHERAVQSLLDAFHEVWVIGKSASPRFEDVIAGKMRKNEKRFKPEDFVVPDGQHPQVSFALGYAKSKMQEGWTRHQAIAYLSTDPLIGDKAASFLD